MAKKHPEVPFVIDFHTHMLDEELRAICTSRNAITGFGKKQAPPSEGLRKFLDPERQIADMDERGIDMHVVFTGPVHMSTWWADAETALKLTRRMNDIIAQSSEYVRQGMRMIAARKVARHARQMHGKRQVAGTGPGSVRALMEVRN